jgi:hypothetical protein
MTKNSTRIISYRDQTADERPRLNWTHATTKRRPGHIRDHGVHVDVGTSTSIDYRDKYQWLLVLLRLLFRLVPALSSGTKDLRGGSMSIVPIRVSQTQQRRTCLRPIPHSTARRQLCCVVLSGRQSVLLHIGSCLNIPRWNCTFSSGEPTVRSYRMLQHVIFVFCPCTRASILSANVGIQCITLSGPARLFRSTRNQRGNSNPILATVRLYRILQLAVFVFCPSNLVSTRSVDDRIQGNLPPVTTLPSPSTWNQRGNCTPICDVLLAPLLLGGIRNCSSQLCIFF